MSYEQLISGIINLLVIIPIISILWLFLISYLVDKLKEWF